MSRPAPHTFFAPAARAPTDVVAAEAAALPSRDLVRTLLDGFPEPAFLLNPERQIVLANDKAERLLDVSAGDLVGRRVGEAFACVHSHEMEHGCGTSPFCRHCGAVRSMLRQQHTGMPDVQECRITTARAGTAANLDLRVWATPLVLGERSYTLFAVRDVTDEKRRGVLEHIFFHDLLNGVAALLGILEIWHDTSVAESGDLPRMARDLTLELLDEIRAQRDLVSAERGELKTQAQDVDVPTLLERLCTTYGHHHAARGKHLAPPTTSGEAVIRTDPVLLSRVLGNLVKNALEASGAGETVRVSYVYQDAPTFTVHNPAVMPEGIQCQVFQRSFTTKTGRGHGIGTYSVKLLTERYLGGQVAFCSVPGEGTTFVLRLPNHPPSPDHVTSSA